MRPPAVGLYCLWWHLNAAGPCSRSTPSRGRSTTAQRSEQGSHHREVQAARRRSVAEDLGSGRTMLAHARAAGEKLLLVRDQEKPAGGFKAWVGVKAEEGHCRFSYMTATKYVRTAERARREGKVNFTPEELEGGIDRYVGYETQAQRAKAAKAVPFTRDDAKHALKLHAMASREGNENEEAASRANSPGHCKGPPCRLRGRREEGGY